MGGARSKGYRAMVDYGFLEVTMTMQKDGVLELVRQLPCAVPLAGSTAWMATVVQGRWL
jgi:hypothetical protein